MTTTLGRWRHDVDCDVYIGRPSPFGNKFKVGEHGSREECLAKYEAWLLKRPKLIERARRELKGRKLGCFCKPGQACHGQILIKYIDGYCEPLDGSKARIYVSVHDGKKDQQEARAEENAATQPDRDLQRKPIKILVTGDREWKDSATIERELLRYKLPGRTTILVHGKCRGADLMADEIGKKLGFVIRSYPAKWKTEGLLAGPNRNARMLKAEHPDEDGINISAVLAFHDDLTKSKGTRDMVTKAKLAFVGTRVVPRNPTCANLVVPPPAGTIAKAPPTVAKKVVSLPQYDPREHGALCDQCPLNGRPVVPPTHPEDMSKVDGIFVGMNPGYEEVRQRLGFVGPSGKQIDKLLHKFDLDRKHFHITNAWLCQHKTEEEAFQASRCCQPRLHREIEKYPKTVPVVPLGKEALQSAFGKKAAITKSRGFLWVKDGRDYLPTLHPAFVLRDKLQLPLISRDFRRLAKRIALGQAGFQAALDKPDYDYEKHTPRSLKQLERLLKLFGNGPVACDIETSEEPPTRAKLICVGISNDERTIVVPWDKQFREPLRQFFKGRQTIFHNGFAFDTIVLARYGVIVDKAEDTLIAHHTFASHFRQGLDHLASFYTDTIPWKILYGKASGEEKGNARNQEEREFFTYNSLDAFLTYLIWQRMQEDLKPHLHLYNKIDKKTAAVCRKMTRFGVLVDLERRQQLIDKIKAKEERLLKQMREACGRDFAPTKVDDIREILFEQFKAPVIERTEKQGLPSTGKKILQSFAATEGRPYSLFCKWLVDWRGCTKMRSTYLDNLPIDKDNRVRPSWRSFGTHTGRFGCRRPNLMNLKRFDKRYKDEPEQHIRQIYVPAEGNCFVTYDMSQVEPRVAAYISNDPAFIAAIEVGDFHTNNARVLFGDLPELLDLKRAKEGDGKPKRDVAKSCGLAVNYMAEAETLKDFLASQGYMLKLSVVQDMIAKLRKGYHVYFKFVQGNIELVQKQGWLQVGMISGRIRWFGFAPSPSSVADLPIQSTAADLMNNRLIAIDRALTKKSYYKKGVKIVAQIHDAVIFEVPINIKEKIKNLIQKKMAKKFVFAGIPRSFPIDMKEGDRWSAL